MTPEETDRVLYRVQGAWPKPIGDATVTIWTEHLTKMDYGQACKAVALLERSSVHQPSIAELWDAYRAAAPPPAARELEAPIDKSAALRVRELVAEVTKPRRPITGDDLDKAGVPNWRARIAHAIECDERLSVRTNYDEAWDAIRAEYVGAKATA